MGATRRVFVLGIVLAGVGCNGVDNSNFHLETDGGIVGTGQPGNPIRLADTGITLTAVSPLKADGMAALGGMLTLSCPTCLTGMGTAGALAKFMGAGSLETAALFEKNGKIGIGTNEPDGTLHTVGGIAIASPMVDYDTRGDAAARSGIIFGANHKTNNIMFWMSPDAQNGGALNLGRGQVYDDASALYSFGAGGDLTVNGRGIFGRLGIGISDPVAPLDVQHAQGGITNTFAARIGMVDGMSSSNVYFMVKSAGGNPSDRRLIDAQYLGASRFVVRGDGNVGIGTIGPAYPLDIQSDCCDQLVWRSSKHILGLLGWSTQQNGYGMIQLFDGNGTVTTQINAAAISRFDNGVNCGTGCAPMSSRAAKQHIRDLDTAKAIQAFLQLRPSEYEYRIQPTEEKLGFIAEDVPDLVAMNDRKSLDPMEFAALLTKVVQEQQKQLAAEQRRNDDLQHRIERLEAALAKSHR